MVVRPPCESWSDSHSFNDERSGRSNPSENESRKAACTNGHSTTSMRLYMSDTSKAISSTDRFRLGVMHRVRSMRCDWLRLLDLHSILQCREFEVSSSSKFQRISIRTKRFGSRKNGPHSWVMSPEPGPYSFRNVVYECLKLYLWLSRHLYPFRTFIIRSLIVL